MPRFLLQDKIKVATASTSDKTDEVRQPTSQKPPKTYQQAISSPEADLWIESMKREMKSLEKFKFAKIVDRTSDMHVLPPQWVFALKKDSENRVKLYKSRLVIRGDRAVYGIDYFESFSPVAKMETIRITLALIILNKLKPLQVDVTTAYLQAELDDDVFLFKSTEYM